MQHLFLTSGYASPDEPGIFRFSYDTSSGFSCAGAWTGFRNPSFALRHPHDTVLYTVSETVPEGGIFAWELTDGAPRMLCAFPSGGAGPCHLCLSGDGRMLYACNYAGGSVASFRLDETGAISGLAGMVQHHGSGLNCARQESAHAHCSMELGGVLYVCDLGLDAILAYRPGTDTLEELFRTPMPAGCGPRHLAASPLHPARLYCAAELAGCVFVLERRADGRLTAVQRVSALPGGFTGPNTTAAIHFSADGRSLLVSNRGCDSIAVFPVGEDGLLGAPVISPCVPEPREFAVFGDTVIAASQSVGVLCAYRLADDRTLRETGHTAPAGTPVCFVEL